MGTPAEIGPPSLTNPLIKLVDGGLLMTVESNKNYRDRSKWFQRVICFRTYDAGYSWDAPTDAGSVPSGRIFNWDQRVGIALDGSLVSFSWVYDNLAGEYRNILRRISLDDGKTWSDAEDIGFADQAGHPALLPDGRVVLPWVDRFETGTIRVRIAADVSSPFESESEVVIYAHDYGLSRTEGGTVAMLDEMGIWTYGLPYAETLENGDVMIVYYAGDQDAMDIQYARLSP